MSTNGGAPARALVRNGGRTAIEETRGARITSPESEEQIQPGEMAYPVGGDPWQVMGWEDPSVMRTARDVELEDLKKMTTRDGHARAMLNVLTWPMRAAKRTVVPDADGEKEAEFCTRMLEDPPHKGGMTTTLDYVLSAHGLAFRDGFKVFEKVTQIRPTREGEDGEFRETLRKLKPLPSDTIKFRYDEYGGFDGVRQTIYWMGRKRIIDLPREKCLLFTVGKEESPLEGESLFLPAYYHYDKKHRLYYIAHIAAQAGATGFRVGTLGPASTSARTKFLDALRSLGLNGAIVAPAGSEVQHFNPTQILGDILSLIEHHDVAMSKSILAHFLDVGTEGKGGLGTATTTSELGDLFVVALEAHLKNIAEGITSYLLPYFIDRNFGTGRYPTFQFEPFSDEQKAAITDTFGKLYNATSPPAPEMMFEIQKSMGDALGLEVDWDAVKDQFDADQELKRELDEESKKAQIDMIKNPPPPAPAAPGKPGGGAGGSGAGASRAPSPQDFMQRAVKLAEAELQGRRVNDAIGNHLTVNDRVVLLSEEEDPTQPTRIYNVQEVVGSTLILSLADADVPENPFASAASAVRLLS